jgi:predicted O-methyltransferase YrrM
MDATTAECCGFPQLDHIDTILSQYPNAIYIHNWRTPADVVRSFDKWGTLSARMAVYGYRYLDGKGTLRAQLIRFVENAQRRTRRKLAKANVTWIDFHVGVDPVAKLAKQFSAPMGPSLPRKNASSGKDVVTFNLGIAIGSRPVEHTPDCFGTLQEPCIARQAIHYLKIWCSSENRSLRVLEFGCGSSTAWFLAQGCSVVSIDHSNESIDMVKHSIKRKAPQYLSAWQPHFVPDAPTAALRDQSNVFYDAYVAKKPSLGTFDIVIVDGRAHRDGLRASIEYVRSGGLLVLDNSKHKRYSEAIAAVPSDWRQTICANAKTETTIWVRT